MRGVREPCRQSPRLARCRHREPCSRPRPDPGRCPPPGAAQAPGENGFLSARFSESERCISGRENVYGADMVGMLMGPKGRQIHQLKEDRTARVPHCR